MYKNKNKQELFQNLINKSVCLQPSCTTLHFHWFAKFLSSIPSAAKGRKSLHSEVRLRLIETHIHKKISEEFKLSYYPKVSGITVEHTFFFSMGGVRVIHRKKFYSIFSECVPGNRRCMTANIACYASCMNADSIYVIRNTLFLI